MKHGLNSRRSWRLVGWLTLALLAACSEAPPEVVRVRVAPSMVVQPDATETIWSAPGMLAAPEHTPLSFRVAGQVSRRLVSLGQSVTAGQVLAELDGTPWQQNLDSAQARLDAARQALDYAQRQWRRDQAQAREQLIAPAQLEQSRNAHAQAQAQWAQAQQAHAQARDQMAYTRLTAPGDGVISEEHAQAGQNVAAGTPVYSLAWGTGLDVTVDVAQQRLASLSVGQQARVVLSADPAASYPAVVRDVAATADPMTRSFRVKLGVEGADGGHLWRPGMTATVQFTQARADGDVVRYTVPATALFHQGGRPAVWRIEPDGALVLQPVDVAGYRADTVTVVGGLSPGQRILTQGVHTVSAGQVVEVRDAREMAAAGAAVPPEAP